MPCPSYKPVLWAVLLLCLFAFSHSFAILNLEELQTSQYSVEITDVPVVLKDVSCASNPFWFCFTSN